VPIITVKVTGLDQAISFFNTVSQQLERTNKMALDEAADVFVNEAKARAHIITGNMRRSITKSVPTGNSITVGATAAYSAFENRRIGSKGGQGPHNFADVARDKTLKALPDILRKHYDQLFKPK
jgi:HK97 gp10 family phage protein